MVVNKTDNMRVDLDSKTSGRHSAAPLTRTWPALLKAPNVHFHINAVVFLSLSLCIRIHIYIYKYINLSFPPSLTLCLSHFLAL